MSLYSFPDWLSEEAETDGVRQATSVDGSNDELDSLQCETRSQWVSLAPARAPLKLSLFHSIVFHIVLKGLSHLNNRKNNS